MENKKNLPPLLPVHDCAPPLWSDRCRPILGLPLSFRTYTLFKDRLVIQSGILIRRWEEIRLYRIIDVSLRQSILQRIFRLGSIRLDTGDITAPKCFIHDVPQAEALSRLISDLSEAERTRVRVAIVEGF